MSAGTKTRLLFQHDLLDGLHLRIRRMRRGHQAMHLVICPPFIHHPRLIQRSQITHFANAVAERFRPQRIVLFGSYAYGKPNQDSDVDLLVVMPEDRRQGRKAVEIRAAINADFPLDLLVRTPEDICWRLAEGDCFLQEVLSKGEVMYEAPHA